MPAPGESVHQDDPDEEEGGEVGEDEQVDGDADYARGYLRWWEERALITIKIKCEITPQVGFIEAQNF